MSVVYDRTMSDAEGLMWRLEKDPHLSSTFSNVSILDRAPDVDAFRRRMERASLVVPRLRQVVRTAPGNLAPPAWVHDSEFDIDRHVRRVALAEPADERALFDLTSLITADPFDRARPLWEFTIVEGLEGGRAALIQKMHHTIADSESGVQLALEYMDFERDAPPPPPPDADRVDRAAENGDDDATDIARDLLTASLRLPLGVARQARELLADPSRIGETTAVAADTVRGILHQLGDTDGARSPLWTRRSLGRHLEVSSAPFDATKLATKRLGGTLNTAFLTIATEAVGRYHAELGAPVDELRASMAISTRTADSGANAFSLVRLLVPTGDHPIDERFQIIQQATDDAMSATSSTSLDSLAAIATALPTSLICRLARQQSQTVDFATSNVKGSPVPVFVGGAQILENYALGPLSGVAFNLTLLSYLGRLDMGINTDSAAVSDPALLSRFVAQAVDDLTAYAE